MPQRCNVCNHPDRAAIEQAHVEGRSLRVIASEFAGTSPWSLARHFKHIPGIIEKVAAHQLTQNRTTARLPARVEQMITELERLTANALRRKDYASALRSIASRLQCLRMIGELSGELRPGGAGEFVPGNAAAAASVVVNLPAAEKKNPEHFVERMRQVYGLPLPKKPDTIM